MPAGVCGKRSTGFEETFASSSSSSSSPAPTSPKRLRSSSFSPPLQPSEFGFGSEDNKILYLMRMFPSLDREVVESVLNRHGHKVDDAIHNLNALCLGDVRPENEPKNPDSIVAANDSEIAGTGCSHLSEQAVVDLQENNVPLAFRNSTEMSSLIKECVEEMMKATDMDDFRARAPRMLDIFASSVASCPRDFSEQQQQLVSLKEQLQSQLRYNQILRRALSIQHERELGQEDKTREVQHLKHLLNQYQQQLHNLEIQNYTLKFHLQRAQESSSIPSRFHPDVF